MKKMLLIPVFVALCAMLLSPVVHAQTETIQFEGKMALAINPLGGTAYELLFVGEGMINFPGPPGPMKGMIIAVLGVDVSTTPPTILFWYAKELAPNEFKWSFGACRVSTEFMSGSLAVEWNTIPPTQTGHINLKDTGIHIILNGAARVGSASWVYDDATGHYTGEWLGLVARGTGNIVYKPP